MEGIARQPGALGLRRSPRRGLHSPRELRHERLVQETLAMATRERERVVQMLVGEFRKMPQVECERCVDEAFDEIWREGTGPLVGAEAAFRAQWLKRARWRALRECERLRYRMNSGASLSEPGFVESLLAPSGEEEVAIVEQIEAERAELRVAELLASLPPQQRRLAQALFRSPPERSARRFIASELGWSADLFKYHARGLRKSLAAFLAARDSGALCQERRSMVEHYLDWTLAARAAGAGLCPEGESAQERFRALWLHLESCDSCRAYAQRMARMEGQLQHALAAPVPLLALLLRGISHRTGALKARALRALIPARLRAGGGEAAGAALASGVSGAGGVKSGRAAGVIVEGGSSYVPEIGRRLQTDFIAEPGARLRRNDVSVPEKFEEIRRRGSPAMKLRRRDALPPAVPRLAWLACRAAHPRVG